MMYLQARRQQVPSSPSVRQQLANKLHSPSLTQMGAQANPLAVYQKNASSSQSLPGQMQAAGFTPQGVHAQRFPQPSVQVHGLRNQQQHYMNSASSGHRIKYLRRRQPTAQLVPPNHQQLMTNSAVRHPLSSKQPRLINSQMLGHGVSCCNRPDCTNRHRQIQMQRSLRSNPSVQYPKLQPHPQQTIVSPASRRSQMATQYPNVYVQNVQPIQNLQPAQNVHPGSNQANQSSHQAQQVLFMSSSESSGQIVSNKCESESDFASMSATELAQSCYQAQQGSSAQNELQCSENAFDDIPVSQVRLFRII